MREGLVAEFPGHLRVARSRSSSISWRPGRQATPLSFALGITCLSDLPKAIETARRFFLIPGSPSVYLERDPEEREQFAVIEIWVEGDVLENFQGINPT